MSPTERYKTLRNDLERNGGILSEVGVRTVCSLKGVVLLESTAARDGAESILFVDPVEQIRALRVGEILPALVRAQMYLEAGYFVAGYVSYEAAPAFLPVPHRDPADEPPYLLWFGVYREALRAARDPDARLPVSGGRPFTIGQIEPEVSESAYRACISTIRRYLQEGNSYQVNYTFPVSGRWDATLADLYQRLRLNQPVLYSSIIRHDGCSLLSFSPELFFSVHGKHVELKPMKGTAPRGRTPEEDESSIAWLKASEKDRAENRMIVDLLRNDIGRLAVPGSVAVRSFFDVEKFASIIQATSTIDAVLKDPPTLVDLFQALFPSGSVTGAPKIETMKIIHEVEEFARGPYTGAIGYASPDGNMTFNVAIRTLVVNERKGSFRVHVGSGVTIASDPIREYEECLQKALFVAREPMTFDLFETIRWSDGNGYHHIADHLRRMHASAAYFGWPFNVDEAKHILAEAERKELRAGEPGDHRVRLQVRHDGTFVCSVRKLEDLSEPVLVGFSSRTVLSSDRFQYHKTTHRQTYEDVLEEAVARGWFDAIVLNERGEVAEGARSNVFIEKDGTLFTPPVSAGALPGTMRRRLLASRKRKAEERSLTRGDILEADRVFVANALRGLIEVQVVA